MGSTTGETSNIEVQKKLWTKFWIMGIPDRVKIVVWRVLHNALPIEGSLKKWGGLKNSGCVFCGYKGEDAKHLFMSLLVGKSSMEKN